MAEDDKERGPGSRLLRERAMKIFSQTRAGMDPAFLEEMKTRFSAFVPPSSGKPPAAIQKSQQTASQNAEPEPVDREKISKIVLQYMKNRKDQAKH